MLTPLQQLKIEIFVDGINVSERARKELLGETSRPISTADYATTSGIPLCIKGKENGEEHDVWVNAPIEDNNPNFVDRKFINNTLDFLEGSFLLKRVFTKYYVNDKPFFKGKQEFKVEPVRVPAYQSEKSQRGIPFKEFATTHTDRVRVEPIHGCALNCDFCDWSNNLRGYRITHIDDILEGIHKAVVDPITPARHILISGGTPRRVDYSSFIESCESIATEFPDFDIDVMMMPVPGLLDARHLHNAGVSGLFVNLELYDSLKANMYAESKFRLVTKESYLKFIEDAVDVYGLGKIKSLLLVGLEKESDTLNGVEELAQRGCDPVLSPFRPALKTPLERVPTPRLDILSKVWEDSQEIITKYCGVKLGPRCVPCHHNTLTFQDGSGKYYCS